MLVSIGKLAMISMKFWHGRTWSIVISNPAKMTFSCPNWNFFGWRVMPLHYNHINQASPLLGKNCSANHLTKGKDHLHILSCFLHLILIHQSYRCSHPLRRCRPPVQLHNNSISMVWWKWRGGSHFHEGEYCDIHSNS